MLEAFARFGDVGGSNGEARPAFREGGSATDFAMTDEGTAARFFYCAKASTSERGPGNDHPTVKPLALMEWLVKLVCPEHGLVLEPFLGSGTTAAACVSARRRCAGIDKEEGYLRIAGRRVAEALRNRPYSAPLIPASERVAAPVRQAEVVEW